MASVTDGEQLRQQVENLVEQALRTSARRPEPLEVREVADGLFSALKEYIDRRVSAAVADTSQPYWRERP